MTPPTCSAYPLARVALPLWPTISTSISDAHIENGCDTQFSDILGLLLANWLLFVLITQLSKLDHQLKASLRERKHAGGSIIAISSKEAFC